MPKDSGIPDSHQFWPKDSGDNFFHEPRASGSSYRFRVWFVHDIVVNDHIYIGVLVDVHMMLQAVYIISVYI